MQKVLIIMCYAEACERLKAAFEGLGYEAEYFCPVVPGPGGYISSLTVGEDSLIREFRPDWLIFEPGVPNTSEHDVDILRAVVEALDEINIVFFSHKARLELLVTDSRYQELNNVPSEVIIESPDDIKDWDEYMVKNNIIPALKEFTFYIEGDSMICSC